MKIFSATEKYKIHTQKNTGDSQNNFVRMLIGNATYAWYSISTLCRHSIHNKKRDKVTLLKKTEIKEQYPDDNYTEEEVYEARQKRPRMTT